MFQKMLTELGYYKGAWDGQFGTGTYNSMEEFQKANNIPRTHGPDPRTLFWLCIKYEQLKDSNK
jgi:peptidoglycan hydrolase-like protein with peptidoglycan-binding domain